MLLALESTGARMSRLGSEVLAGAPLLDLDEMEAAIDAVTISDLQELADELWDPARLAVAGIGPDEERFAAGRAGARRPRRPHDPGGRQRGCGADGLHRLRRRPRAPRTWSSWRRLTQRSG